MNYNDSVRKIKGVGEKAENYLHKLDIFQVGDLLEHYPRDYDEFKELVPISELQERLWRWRECFAESQR